MRATSRTFRSARGSALLLAMVVVLVVAVIGVAVIRMSSRELAGATAARQTDALVACAEAGRQVLMNQFRSIGTPPTSITALNVPLDATTGGRIAAAGGHVDEAVASVQVDQVKLLPAGTFGTSRGAIADLTNIIGGVGALGNGNPYRVLVRCLDGAAADGTGGRQVEVEFGVQFGI
jgi:hypothetical protein